VSRPAPVNHFLQKLFSGLVGAAEVFCLTRERGV
jgi:hypothetical protein